MFSQKLLNSLCYCVTSRGGNISYFYIVINLSNMGLEELKLIIYMFPEIRRIHVLIWLFYTKYIGLFYDFHKYSYFSLLFFYQPGLEILHQIFLNSISIDGNFCYFSITFFLDLMVSSNKRIVMEFPILCKHQSIESGSSNDFFLY